MKGMAVEKKVYLVILCLLLAFVISPFIAYAQNTALPTHSIGFAKKIGIFERGLEVYWKDEAISASRHRVILTLRNPTEDDVTANCMIKLSDAQGKVVFSDTVYFDNVMPRRDQSTVRLFNVEKGMLIDKADGYLLNVRFKANNARRR
jgi:hypothetical protein